MTSGVESGRLVAVDGVDLYVREAGQGPPVVLVQPGLVSGEVYAALTARLAGRFRVVTFDSRGHGRSTSPGGALSYDLLADDTAGLIRALGLDRPFVGGWSDGGEVALRLGLRHPGLARGLVAGGTSLVMGGDERARAETRAFFHVGDGNAVDLDAFAAAHESGLLPLLRRSHPNGEERWRDVVRRSAEMWLTYEGLSRDEAARITMPALVVAGDRDESHPLDAVVGLSRWLPAADLAILPGSDHMRPVFEPEVLAPVLFDFFERH